MKEIVLVVWIVGMLFLFILSIILMVRGNKSTADLHDEADRIEKRIRAGDDYNLVFDDFIAFYDKAQRNGRCSGRTWELAKMIEVKYDVDIIGNK